MKEVICYVNFTYECFYRIDPLEKRVDFVICIEDEETYIGSFSASEIFIQFVRERLYPIKEATFNRVFEDGYV